MLFLLFMLGGARSQEETVCNLQMYEIHHIGTLRYVQRTTVDNETNYYCIPHHYLTTNSTAEVPCYRCDPHWHMQHHYEHMPSALLVIAFAMMLLGCACAARALFTYARAFVVRKTN